jgi:hypothetical protein
MSTALENLARRLRVPPDRVPAMSQYDEDRVAAYDRLVQQAMEREHAALAHALEEALTHIPRLLRPMAKKMLGGGHE